MKEAWTSLLSSRKAWVVMLALVAITVLASLGKVAGELAIDVIKWVVVTWLGAQAFEDSKVKSAALMQPPKASADDPAP
jgi:hypothetical protein